MVLHLFIVFSQSVANNAFLNQSVDSIVWTLFSASLESGLSSIVRHRFICLTPKTWTPCKACEVLLWAWSRQNFPTDWLHKISFPSSKNYDCVTENEFPDAKERQVYNRTKTTPEHRNHWPRWSRSLGEKGASDPTSSRCWRNLFSMGS